MRSRSRSRHPHTDMRIDHANIAGRRIRYGVREGDITRPPLLILNGLGANIELAQPFIDALPGPTVAIFDVPGVGGSPMPRVSISARGDRPSCRRAPRPSRVCGSRRARRVVGRRDRAAVRVPASVALSPVGACGDGSRRRHGARASLGDRQDGNAEAVHRQPARPSRRRRYLWRRIPARSRARVAHAPPHSFFRKGRLLPSARGRFRLDEPAVALHPASANAGHGRRRRSADPDDQRPHSAVADSGLPARDPRLRALVSHHPSRGVGARRRSVPEGARQAPRHPRIQPDQENP